jgi:ABC-type antimicrobial peptide transport system permease subunit
MIADSRRETAVFRAIGAKRIDIAQVYVLYTILLALLICIFAISVGMVVAAVFQQKFSPAATVQALVAYNAQDLSRQFSLFYVYLPDMLRLVGLVFAASIISSFLPLLRNLRRNPIRDMRDDT